MCTNVQVTLIDYDVLGASDVIGRFFMPITDARKMAPLPAKGKNKPYIYIYIYIYIYDDDPDCSHVIFTLMINPDLS